MSQIQSYFTVPIGPGTVTMVSGGVGINITGNPTINPTVNLDIPVTIAHGGTNATSMTNTNGVNYFNGTSIVTTTVGTAGQVLTSQGAGLPPIFSSFAPGGVVSVSGGHDIFISGTASNPIVNVTNAITLGDITPIGPGSPAITLTTGDIEMMTGSIYLPATTTPEAGVIYVNSIPFMQSFGTNNAFFAGAGNFTLSGNENLGIGFHAFQNATTGQANVAVGYLSQSDVTTASQNTSAGVAALESITVNGNNTAVGFESLVSATGSGNTAIGSQSGLRLLGGSYNCLFGFIAGDVYTTTESSNVLISNEGVIGDNHTIRIGTQGNGNGQQDLCYIAGIVGVTTSNTNVVTIDTTTGQLGAAVPLTLLQIFDGDTGSASGATITLAGGTGISTSASGSTVTITSTATPFTWSVITANQTAAINNGYICNKASTLTLTLPTTSAVGSIIEVTGINNATGWLIAQNASQQIFFGTASTTAGVTGSLASSATRDSLRMVCVVADLTWNVLSSVGNITVV